jgi:trigger factor
MQVTETSIDGLRRELKIVVEAGELSKRFETKLEELKGTINLKGFRPGKVPVAYLRKVFGRHVMTEVLEQTISETSRKVLEDRRENPVDQPELVGPEEAGEIEGVLEGRGDFVYTMKYEVLPKIEPMDPATLGLVREVVDIEPAHIDEGIERLVERSIEYVSEADRAALAGDRVTIDYLGRIDGVEFEGGKADDAPIVLGEGGFIPGFEEGLTGAKPGEERLVRVTFPAEYAASHLAGKDAAFEVKVKEVARPVKPEVGDEFAKTLGVENLEKLREFVGEQIRREFSEIAREKLKRQIFDAFDKGHQVELPQSIVEREIEQMLAQAKEASEREGRPFPLAGKSEDDMKVEARPVAERRVRLGLVLGAIGERAEVEVTQEELRRALIQEARRYPGQERMVYEFFEKNRDALAQLRGPLYENKVIDAVIAQANLGERRVTREELLRMPEAPEGTPGPAVASAD